MQSVVLKFCNSAEWDTPPECTRNRREAAIRYGEQMPAARVVINSPTTHGAIGFSTDFAPSMTLGCGSWGGNVTSDNVSPIHLMDIKRVAFETKPVNTVQSSKFRSFRVRFKIKFTQLRSKHQKSPKREEIAAIVDKFLSKKLSENPIKESSKMKKSQIANRKSQINRNRPVKTIIHELKPQEPSWQTEQNRTQLILSARMMLDCAVEKGEKIYITAKTIITPSARDLGEEKEIFAKD